MDPITHTMAGAVIARAGLDRGGRLPLAGATLMLAANAPDIDILVMFVGNYAGLAFRRGWTHGPVALVVLPLLLTALMAGIDRLARRRTPARPAFHVAPILAIATLGVISHPLLDWLNTYGIRLLMPLSGRWFYGDALFIIDPWLWLLFAGALMPWRRTRRRVQAFGAAAVAYVLVMIGASTVAEPIGRLAAEADGIKEVEEVMYQPLPAQPHRAVLIVASADTSHGATGTCLPSTPHAASRPSATTSPGRASPSSEQTPFPEGWRWRSGMRGSGTGPLAAASRAFASWCRSRRATGVRKPLLRCSRPDGSF
jgi:inner membrane protein